MSKDNRLEDGAGDEADNCIRTHKRWVGFNLAFGVAVSVGGGLLLEWLTPVRLGFWAWAAFIPVVLIGDFIITWMFIRNPI